jgi:hypothetical protein
MKSSTLVPMSRVIITVGVMALLWAAAGRSCIAQRGIFAVLQPTQAAEPGSPRTLPDALRSAGPRLRLTRMDSIGDHRPPESLRSEHSLSGRESLAAGSITQMLLERFTRPGRRRDHLLRMANSATRLVHAPNRALCRLTGADRAHINLSKRRVSFTWFVSFW